MIQNRSGTRRLEICTSMNIKDYKLYEYKLRFRRINKEREREREKNKGTVRKAFEKIIHRRPLFPVIFIHNRLIITPIIYAKDETRLDCRLSRSRLIFQVTFRYARD